MGLYIHFQIRFQTSLSGRVCLKVFNLCKNALSYVWICCCPLIKVFLRSLRNKVTQIDSFHVIGLFLYPLKHQKNWCSDIFRGYRKRLLVGNGLIDVNGWSSFSCFLGVSQQKWKKKRDKVFKNGPSKICGRQTLEICLKQIMPPSNIIKAVFHKFYLVHYWILRLK